MTVVSTNGHCSDHLYTEIELWKACSDRYWKDKVHSTMQVTMAPALASARSLSPFLHKVEINSSLSLIFTFLLT